MPKNNSQFHNTFFVCFVLSFAICQGSEQSEDGLSSLYSALFNNADVVLPSPSNTGQEVYHNDDSLVASLQRISSENLRHSLEVLSDSEIKFTTSASECLRDLTIIFNDIHPKSEVYKDAWPKIPAGFLRGTTKFFGDFDECLSIGKVLPFEFTPHSCYFGLIGSQVELPPLTGGIYDPFLSLTFSVCVPNTCGEKEIDELVNSLANPEWTTRAGLTYCQKQQVPFSSWAILAIVLFSFMGLFLLGGLLLDLYVRWEKVKARRSGDKTMKNSLTVEIKRANTKTGYFAAILLCFSPLANLEKLLSYPKPTNAVPNLNSVNAIRSLSMMWVVLGHMYSQWGFYGDNLRTNFAKFERLSTQFLVAGIFAVDTFFFLSGFLAYWSLAKRMKAPKFNFLFNLPIIYLYRYIRLTPALFAVILINTGLWGHLHDGPFFFQGTDSWCDRNWWATILYVNNFVNSKEMCVGWSWYLSVDFQLFIVAPFFIYFFVKSPKFGWLMSILAMLGHIIATIVITAVYNVPSTSGKSSNYEQLLNETGYEPKNYEEYNSLYYVKPYTRMGPYFVGIILAHVLVAHEKTVRKVLRNKAVNIVGWLLCFALFLTLMYSQYGIWNGQRLDPEWVDCLYNSLARSVWGLAIGWVLITCAVGSAGIIGDAMHWPGWAIPARLSYSAYLVHILVLVFFLSTSRRAIHVTDIVIIFDFVGVMVVVFFLSTLFSIAFESPIVRLLH